MGYIGRYRMFYFLFLTKFVYYDPFIGVPHDTSYPFGGTLRVAATKLGELLGKICRPIFKCPADTSKSPLPTSAIFASGNSSERGTRIYFVVVMLA